MLQVIQDMAVAKVYAAYCTTIVPTSKATGGEDLENGIRFGESNKSDLTADAS